MKQNERKSPFPTQPSFIAGGGAVNAVQRYADYLGFVVEADRVARWAVEVPLRQAVTNAQ